MTCRVAALIWVAALVALSLTQMYPSSAAIPSGDLICPARFRVAPTCSPFEISTSVTALLALLATKAASP